jgi:PAS domain S-box-containing protein
MYVNQQFAEMLGYSSNELVGTTANHLITDIESLEKVSKAILERQDKKSSHYQVLMNKKMGIGFGCT